jgi:hypothetical protein
MYMFESPIGLSVIHFPSFMEKGGVRLDLDQWHVSKKLPMSHPRYLPIVRTLKFPKQLVLGMVDSKGQFSLLVRFLLQEYSSNVYLTFHYVAYHVENLFDLEGSGYEYKGSHPGLSNSILWIINSLIIH